MAKDNCFIDFEPIGRRAACQPGVDLLTIAREAGINIASVCGGKGTCGRCRIKVQSGNVSPLSDTERRVLREDANKGMRLACLTRVYGDAKIYVPPSSMTVKQRTQIEGEAVNFALDPLTKVITVELSEPPLTDLRADALRLRDYVREQTGLTIDYDLMVLRHLSDWLRRGKWHGRMAVRGQEVVTLLHPDEPALGLAVDLGTTKVAGYLVNLETGATLASEGVMNPQISYGEDVMARIAYALESAEHAHTLRDAVISGLSDLARTLCHRAGCSTAAICDAVVVGNTAMHHIFLGLPVQQLGNAPYLAAVSDALDVKARDIPLPLAEGAYVHLLPNIAGFVGADHVSMVLATGAYEAKETTLALDIGTNTEIALYHEGRLVTCSCASGPAFEGAHISFGMRAADGAIERVQISNGDVRYQTINDQPAVGICGSGILDAVAQMYNAGILDIKGGMQAHSRVRDTENGKEFVLASAAETANGQDIVVTRGDVGQIQLAKAAIRAGVEVLLQEVGITAADIRHFIVAGAFGSYIDLESAVTVGMFPNLPLERFEQVGNAAGAGARMTLLSRAARQKAIEIAKAAKYIELTNDMRFVELYTLAMFLSADML